MAEPRVPGGRDREIEPPCGRTIEISDLDMGLREFDCACGSTHAVVMDVHPLSRFVPEFLVAILRETVETADDYDEFTTAHAMGIVRVAGWYNPTISTAIVASGSSARSTSVCSDMGFHPRLPFVRTRAGTVSMPRETVSRSHVGTTSVRGSIARNLPIQRFLIGCISHVVWQGVFIPIYCLHYHLPRITPERGREALKTRKSWFILYERAE